jgi:hypothetical protein
MPFIGGSCIGFIPLKKNSIRLEGKLLVAAVATEKNAINHRVDANSCCVQCVQKGI